MTARVYRAEDDDARRTGERPIARGGEDRELVRLRMLWYALRARGLDACGAPGIAYDRPVVQSSPQQPAAPHGYGMGHARDAVAAWLGIDDGPRGPVAWEVVQEIGKGYAVRIAILGGAR